MTAIKITTPHTTHDQSPNAALVALAFLTVYLGWGGTYLGIRFAIETMPPFLMAGSRFFAAGVILLACLRIFHSPGFHWGTIREWRDAIITGVLLLLCGNGGLTWAEQFVPSGVASLFFALTPLWMVLFDWLHPGGKTPSPRVALGLVLGFIGIWILREPASAATVVQSGDARWAYVVLLLMAVCWGAGSIYARHNKARGSILLPIARQMISGGIALMLAGLPNGDFARFHFAEVTIRSWIGYGYLLTVGSLLGFTAYAWLLKVSTPARVGTTAYINPIVAIFLGWSLGHEPVSWRLAFSALAIVTSVLIVMQRKKPVIGRNGIFAPPE